MRKSELIHYIYAYIYVAVLPKCWGIKHNSAPHALLKLVEKTPPPPFPLVPTPMLKCRFINR